MNALFSRLENFTSQNNTELLGLSLAYMGEFLKKSAEQEVFRPEKIALVHYNILSSLSMQSPRTASSIAPAILGSPANFSAILSRMEKEGLIFRENSKKDKREVFVSWTGKGKEKFNTVQKKFQAFFETQFLEISDQEKENAINVIKKIFHSINC